MHPGVYVDHTGELSWLQRAWAAVLFADPAALCHDSAIRVADAPERRAGADSVIHVAIDRTREVAALDGVRFHLLARLDAKARWNLSPPRVRIEEAVLDVAAEASSDTHAINRLAHAVQSRHTTAGRLLTALERRPRIARRAFLTSVLGDIGQGTCSVLEHGYLDRVERPHGLPTARRQVRASSHGPIYRDVDYEDHRLVVELDGRLFHDNAVARDQDLDRDLDAVVDGRTTVRLGWGQVFGRPCATAVKVGSLLQQRGWTGRPLPCAACTLTAPGISVAG